MPRFWKGTQTLTDGHFCSGLFVLILGVTGDTLTSTGGGHRASYGAPEVPNGGLVLGVDAFTVLSCQVPTYLITPTRLYLTKRNLPSQISYLLDLPGSIVPM